MISFKIEDFVVKNLQFALKSSLALCRGEHFAKWKFVNLVEWIQDCEL